MRELIHLLLIMRARVGGRSVIDKPEGMEEPFVSLGGHGHAYGRAGFGVDERLRCRQGLRSVPRSLVVKAFALT
jgi:hypothetical protein